MQRARGISATVFVALLAAASGAIITSASPDAVAQTAQATTARIVAAAQAVLTPRSMMRAPGPVPVRRPSEDTLVQLAVGIFQRQGLRLAELTTPQRAAVTTLLQRR